MFNLTQHDIKLIMSDGSIKTFPPSGIVARVETIEHVEQDCVIDGVTISTISRTTQNVTGLPECPPDHGGVLVSSMVLDHLPASIKGVYAPDTGKTAIRDSSGQVVAVKRLITKPSPNES